MVRNSDQRAQVQRTISRLRRQAGERSLLAFARTYLPAHFSKAASAMHREMGELLEKASHERGLRLAAAAPRGHAKSTIVSLAYVLWAICYGKEPFIYLISHTIDQASDNLSHIKRELQDNPLLHEDFPEVCENSEIGPMAPRWRREEIITRNDIKVTALGAEKKIRGRRHNEHRPSLIILDDVENEEDVRSADQRRHRVEWFEKSVLKAGNATTNVIVIGTILHFDSLLSGLLNQQKSPGWDKRVYRAVIEWSIQSELWAQWESIYGYLEEHEGYSGPRAAERFFQANREAMLEGTQVLWPQVEDYHRLMLIRIQEGRASFDSEKQNNPVNPEDCLFQESDFKYWDDQFSNTQELLMSLEGRGIMYGACDPSMGRQGKNSDDSAIIGLVQDARTRVMYILDADIRRRKPDSIIDHIIEYQRIRKFDAFGMETNQFQLMLADELRRRALLAGVEPNVQDINHTSDKLGRIQKLQAYICSGQLRFSRRHLVLLDQLRQFPMGAHDDGPDALEMAVQMACNPPAMARIRCLGGDEDRAMDDERMWTTFGS